MPELPEVEVVKRSLVDKIQNSIVKAVKINDGRLRYRVDKNKIKKIIGLKIKKISRRSKFLLFFFNNNSVMLVHLGMTGKFFFINQKNTKYKTSFYYDINEDKDKKHDRVIFNLSKNRKLIYNDVRKFGFIKFYNFEELNDSKHLKDMGPEPFSGGFNLNYFTKKIKRKCSVKNLLMNQKFVAGLGNIYCSEILFDAGVNPEKICNELSKKQIEKIILSTRRILEKAINFGGTTIKNFVVNNEKIGYFKNKLKVYGKENQSCPRCKSLAKIQRIKQSGRSTFLCTKCQN